MWDSGRRWKTDSEVKKEVRALKLKNEKESGIKDNIQMHYKGLGQVESKITWSKNGRKKTISELQDCYIEIIRLPKQWHVPDKLPTTAPHRI